jgi:hypothetical protein
MPQLEVTLLPLDGCLYIQHSPEQERISGEWPRRIDYFVSLTVSKPLSVWHCSSATPLS